MTRRLAPLAALLLASAAALAHHGVAGLGAAGLEGPGAPIEAASSSVLPQGRLLLYGKLDHAAYPTYDPAVPEADYANYWLLGGGYGVTPWLSVYAFQPYNEKIDEDGGFSTRGLADLSLFGQLGFKYDDGFRLIPAGESLDDLEDWHFTVLGGGSLPTGDADLRDTEGRIDPGKSTSFGKPSFSYGLTATKMLGPRWTFDLELSRIHFQAHTYADRNRSRFGTESRANSALAYRLYTNPDAKLRLDLDLEVHYLHLDRDRSNGTGERATGGDILYALPGLRLYWDNLSLALGLKRPIWTRLNESSEQQGAEGKEAYRLILSASLLF